MSAPGLSPAQLADWLRLIRSENVGPRTFQTLINRFGGAAAALEALPALIAKGGRAIVIADRGEIEREIAAVAKRGARFVTLADAHYPAALRAIEAPPPVLTVKGDVAMLARPMAAIVGSRNASAAGLAFAERLARGLGHADYVVVSGLARGIDARAHRAALPTGTIAVLAGGLDRLYPPEHAALADEICDRGLLLTEMPIGWEPRGRDFPRRNRVVSGLSLGTIVVEAALRSGSLITARFAVEQGREVFAVPGSPLDPRAEGTNDLLRQGATLCTRPSDVVDALAPLAGGEPSPAHLRETEREPDDEPLWDEADLDDESATPPPRRFREPAAATSAPVARQPAAEGSRERIVALLGPAPVSVDELIRVSETAARDVRAILIELDLEGRLERHGGDLVSLL